MSITTGDQPGRGIVLMRALMDDVELDPGPEGTTVRMRRRLGREPQTAPDEAPDYAG